MTLAIKMDKTGGPDVLHAAEVKVPAPAAGEIKIRHTAIGLNYIDTYHRSGLYPVPLPAIPGLEATGVVEEVGSEVKDLQPGDRIAYMTGPLGAYAQERTIPANKVIKLPDYVSDECAAAMMLKACTVEYLTFRTYPVKSGDTVLIHAAAGGVGLIACQWLSARGVTVIGTVGSEEKAELARANGCDHPILYREEDVAKKVRDLTNGQGVPVVYDSVGKSTFEASLGCLQPRGLLVSFGNASGPVDNVDLGILAAKGSLYVTRPSLMAYYADRDEFEEGCHKVFSAFNNGAFRLHINQRFALAEARRAHQALEARETTGSTLLIP